MTYEDWIIETRHQAGRYRAVRRYAGWLLVLVALAALLASGCATAAGPMTGAAAGRVAAPLRQAQALGQLSSPWCADVCQSFAVDAAPKLEWDGVASPQLLDARKWTLTAYDVRVYRQGDKPGQQTSNPAIYTGTTDTRWQAYPLAVAGTWCFAVRASGVVTGLDGQPVAPTGFRIRPPQMGGGVR